MQVSGATTRTFGGLPVRSVKEIALARKVCLAIFGDPGVGKTTLAATIMDSMYAGERMLILDAEGGSHVVAHRDDVDVIPIMTWPQLVKVVDDLKRDQPWGTVVFDNMSEIQDLSVSHVDKSHPDWKDMRPVYRESGDDLIEMVRAVRDLARNGKFNVIFVAWDRQDTDEKSKITATGIGLTPSFSKRFRGSVDFVGFLSKERSTETRVLDFEQSSTLNAKRRTTPGTEAANIPLKIYNPSLATILDTIAGGVPWPHDRYKAPPRPTLTLAKSTVNNESSKEGNQ